MQAGRIRYCKISAPEFICIGLLILIGCSTPKEDEQTDGHWHCIKLAACEFETIDIQDSTIIGDKYIVGNYRQYLYIEEDLKVDANGDGLSLNYPDTSFQFYRSDSNKCLLKDRYRICMIDLSLPVVEWALSFDDDLDNYTTADLLLGKLKQGSDESLDKFAQQYPDSIFVQVNDVLIGFDLIPEYLRQLKDCLDCPEPSINLHVDKDVPEAFVSTVIRLINPGENPTTKIYNVVKIRNGDIGLIRERGLRSGVR